jgi:hypothetical protein
MILSQKEQFPIFAQNLSCTMPAPALTHEELLSLPLVLVDLNHFYFGPDDPTVSRKRVNDLKLKANDVVIAHDDADAWLAIVQHDPELDQIWRWWVELGEDVDFKTYVAPRLRG